MFTALFWVLLPGRALWKLMRVHHLDQLLGVVAIADMTTSWLMREQITGVAFPHTVPPWLSHALANGANHAGAVALVALLVSNLFARTSLPVVDLVGVPMLVLGVWIEHGLNGVGILVAITLLFLALSALIQALALQWTLRFVLAVLAIVTVLYMANGA